ncbi:MAG: carbohydrate binding family 9 domain-containing protein, partial [Gammaproteobacteria bacterium]|nr:carbohydrate binding family 9 domain-containing protein [Gammaproteobacteria bacterium]
MDDKRFRVNHVSEAPQIDGRIDLAEWQEAARISDMHEIEPVEFTTPSERTVWYFGYDEKALYVAGYAYDSEPDKISASVLRQGGSLFPDDRMVLIIDPFNNKRSGYSFTLNPNGVREEAIYATATRASDEWDGIWRGASRVVDDGWTMEMAIPFNTITFDPENDTWGINVWRRIARKAERIGWESRNGQTNPTVSGEAFGLTGMSQGVGLDIIPSASSVYRNDRVASTTDSEFNPSVDISYKLTPSINGLVTFNTDFAATEVDSRQLDLQRFSLFFPEKRGFFLTDFDIFQFGGVPTGGGGFGNRVVGMRSGTNGLAFFSRRIGLTSDREPVDIIAGGKVSGRIGDTDFGTLYILQDDYVTSDGDVIDQSDLVVTRVSTGVLEESSVGAIFTYGDPGSNLTSSLVGTDFLYRNTRIGINRAAEGRFWLQKSDNDGVDGDDLAWSATVGFPSRIGREGGVQIHEVQENFDPALGFANRTGVRLYGGELGYRRNREGDVFIREVSHGLEVAHWEYLDTGGIQSEEISFDYLSLRSSSGDFFRLDFKLQKEGLLAGEQPLDSIGINIPSGEHSFQRWGAFMRTASFRKFRVQLRVDDGGYYDGDRLSIRPELEWRPNEHLAFKVEFDYSKYEFPGNQEATTRQLTFENEISFNAKMSLVTLAQYDNVSEDIGINSRFRYNLSAGQDIWFVLNHNMSRDVLVDDRFRSTESQAAAKIRYTFRY